MKIRVPNYYKDFKCIAGACTDTCCAGWQVDVDDRSFQYYKKIQGPFGERLRSVMREGKNGAEGQFEIRPDGRCPFLNDENLCDLYTELGEDALCVTCEQYPRYTCEFGSLRETGIALSCLTAAELILRKDENPGFTESEDEESFFGLNNIDGTLFLKLTKARKTAFSIVHNQTLTIDERMAVLLLFGDELQKNIKKPDKIKEIVDKYDLENGVSDGKPFAKLLQRNEKGAKSAGKTVKTYRKIWLFYMKQVIIKREWPKLCKTVNEMLYNENIFEKTAEFKECNKEWEYEYENILAYFIFRYFLKAVFDYRILTKVKMAVISTIMIRQCDIGAWLEKNKELSFEDRTWIAHLYSREVEHSEENFDALSKIFDSKKVFNTNNILRLL